MWRVTIRKWRAACQMWNILHTACREGWVIRTLRVGSCQWQRSDLSRPASSWEQVLSSEDPVLLCLHNCSQICLWTNCLGPLLVPQAADTSSRLQVVPAPCFFYFVAIFCGVRSMFPCEKSLSGHQISSGYLHPSISFEEDSKLFLRKTRWYIEDFRFCRTHSPCDDSRFCLCNVKVATDSHPQLVKLVCPNNIMFL